VSEPTEKKSLHGSKTDYAAWVGVLVAVVAAFYAGSQAHSAKTADRLAEEQSREAKRQNEVSEEQNEVAERETLTTLVSELARESRALSATPEGEAERAIEHAQLADAEEAFGLVAELRTPAAAVDNVEIGGAFQEQHEDAKALVSYERAVEAEHSPTFRSVALRREAVILYDLGLELHERRQYALARHDIAGGRYDIALAEKAYENIPDTARAVADYNRATVLLYGAEQGMLNCGSALDRARRIVSGDRASLTVGPLGYALDHVEKRCPRQ
jgi:tetratricopeptide (TPR) repeat protein